MDIRSFLLGRASAGGSGGGGGGGDIVTGTITFENDQPATSLYTLTHNLGKTPSGVAWMIESTTSKDSMGYLSYGFAGLCEIMTPHVYMAGFNPSSSGKDLRGRFAKEAAAESVWSSLEVSETTINIFTANGNRISSTIPANSTIRWFVW